MKKNKIKKEVIRSMIEFEKTFFPKAFEKKESENILDAHELGIKWAKESLEKVKSLLEK